MNQSSTQVATQTTQVVVVTQEVLAKIHSLRTERLDLEKWAREIKDQESMLLSLALRAIEDGAGIEAGAYVLIERTLGRYPDWREAFAARLGAEAAQAVIDATLPRTSWQVEQVATPPAHVSVRSVVEAVVATAR